MIPYEELVQALSSWRRRRGLPVGPFQFLEDRSALAHGTSPGLSIERERASLGEDEVLVTGDFGDDIDLSEQEPTVVARHDLDTTAVKPNPLRG